MEILNALHGYNMWKAMNCSLVLSNFRENPKDAPWKHEILEDILLDMSNSI